MCVPIPPQYTTFLLISSNFMASTVASGCLAASKLLSSLTAFRRSELDFQLRNGCAEVPSGMQMVLHLVSNAILCCILSEAQASNLRASFSSSQALTKPWKFYF